MTIKYTFLTFLFLCSTSQAVNCRLSPEHTDINKDWAFFDLGNTIVDTQSGAKKFKYNPGALDYLKKLKKSGYRLGLISNIPVEWGENFDERLLVLKKDIKDNLLTHLPQFDWAQFDRIYLPGHESHYKPNPYMFEKALTYARSKGAKRVYFQGENALEVKKASELGMTSHQIKVVGDVTEFLKCK